MAWSPRQRNYEAEKNATKLPTEITFNHPLKSITVTLAETKTKSKTSSTQSSAASSPIPVRDPLSSALEGLDPLSQFAAQAESSKSPVSPVDNKAIGKNDWLDGSFELWSAKKLGILSKFTTSEKLSITTSFLSGGPERERVVLKAQTTGTVSEKLQHRIEQLDDFEEGSIKEMLNLSQQEYIKRIEELNQELIKAWGQDQRVKSLKIAIQCAKMLTDTAVIQFYPSKFVLITDILDTFGKLVYERIHTKSVYYPKGGTGPVRLPENFTPEQVPDTAKETCRNWFFKIASIRELVPRFYVETAILKCYGFLAANEYPEALLRLSSMTRGLGDPLVSIYAKCYLCRVGIDVAPQMKDHLMPCYLDFLVTYPQIQSDSVQNVLAIQNVEISRYMTLYSPALDWLLQCISHKASDRTLLDVLQQCKQQCNSALLLNSIMAAFKPDYIAERAVQFTSMIKECEEASFPKQTLYRTLGLCLILADPPEDQRLAVLNEVWKVVMKLKNPGDYISLAEVWIEYVVKNFSKRELNTILTDVIKHMSPDRAFEDYYLQLQNIVSKILAHLHDFSLLFSLDKFLSFIDLFQKDSIKVDVCKNITDAFVRHQVDQTNDPVIMNALMFICKTMHDSVNALSLEDERRNISKLINGFISKISFGRDFEQQLSFYVEARSTYTNLDLVLIHLVHCVNSLAMRTREVVNGNHTRKTAAFVRACAAYCFITIPSLDSVLGRLTLYLQSGQVAMLNHCLSQSEAFLKASIALIPEFPKTVEIDAKNRNSEPILFEFLSNFCSTLLVVQDNPDQGVLYLVRGLLNALEHYPWSEASDTKMYLYINVITLMSAMSVETYLYHVDKVEANDAMYGSDPKFLNEVSKISSTLVDAVLKHLKTLEQAEAFKRQSNLAFDLFNKLVFNSNLQDPEVLKLALNLWSLVQKHGLADTKLMVRVHEAIKRRANNGVTGRKDPGFSSLSSSLHLQSRA